jgi:mono/diheme cytochrome c family protein
MSPTLRLPRVAALLAAATLAACATARRGETLTGEHHPPTDEIALGQRVYDANCSQCHPGGTQGVGPSINDKPLPRWAIRFQVRHGLGAMPSFSKEEIPDAELHAVVKYLKWLRGLEVK